MDTGYAAVRRSVLARHAARTIVRGSLLLAGLSLLCFVLFQLTPGDFFVEAHLNSTVSAADLAALRAHHALDRPILLKYWYWLGSVSRGEWGFSFAYNRPAGDLLWARAANTLLLTVTANVIAWVIAILLGVWSAGRSRKLAGALVGGCVSVLLALPDLLIVLLLLFAAARTGLLPLGGMFSAQSAQLAGWPRLSDRLAHLVLPATALALSMLPPLVEHARSAMSDVLGSTYIRAARASGISQSRILFRHAIPAAANALLSLLGLSVGMLLSSSLLVETVFGWPGLGQLLFQATLERDVYVVIDVVMLSAFLLLAGNFVTDLLQRAADPRIRAE